MKPSKAAYAASLLLACGLVFVASCGNRDSVASRSDRALREALARGETVSEEAGHMHGHAGASGAGGTDVAESHASEGERHPSEGQGHSNGAQANSAGHDSGSPHAMAHDDAGQTTVSPSEHHHMEAQEGGSATHAMHGRSQTRSEAAGEHADHEAPSGTPARTDEGHAQHGDEHAAMTQQDPRDSHEMAHPTQAATAPVPGVRALDAAPGQPARTLQPDSLDAPAETSVEEAEQAAAMAVEMGGHGHGAHDATYKHQDAGRLPAAEDSHQMPARKPASDPHAGHGQSTHPPGQDGGAP